MFWLVFITLVLILSFAGDIKVCPPKIACLFRSLLVISLTYVVSFGSAISTDHLAYVSAYQDSVGMKLSELNLLSFGRSAAGLGYEPGYMALSIVGHAFNLGMPGFLFCVLGFVNAVYISFAYKHKFPVLSILFFVLSNIYILETNLVRQSIAMSIVFLSFSFIQNKRFVPSLLLILLGITFHISAIVLIPVSLFAFLNFETHKRLLCNIAAAIWISSIVVGIMGISIPSDFMFLGGDNTTYYDKYYSNSNDTGMEGTFDLILNCAAIFILSSLRKTPSIFTVFLLFGVALSNVSMAIPNIGRVALYFTVLAPLYYTTILTELPKHMSKWGQVFLWLLLFNSIRLLLFNHILNGEKGLGSVMYPLSSFFAS